MRCHLNKLDNLIEIICDRSAKISAALEALLSIKIYLPLHLAIAIQHSWKN
jgi:hypothetical protein